MKRNKILLEQVKKSIQFQKLYWPLACFIYFTSEIYAMGRTEISVSTLDSIIEISVRPITKISDVK